MIDTWQKKLNLEAGSWHVVALHLTQQSRFWPQRAHQVEENLRGTNELLSNVLFGLRIDSQMRFLRLSFDLLQVMKCVEPLSRRAQQRRATNHLDMFHDSLVEKCEDYLRIFLTPSSDG